MIVRITLSCISYVLAAALTTNWLHQAAEYFSAFSKDWVVGAAGLEPATR